MRERSASARNFSESSWVSLAADLADEETASKASCTSKIRRPASSIVVPLPNTSWISLLNEWRSSPAFSSASVNSFGVCLVWLSTSCRLPKNRRKSLTNVRVDPSRIVSNMSASGAMASLCADTSSSVGAPPTPKATLIESLDARRSAAPSFSVSLVKSVTSPRVTPKTSNRPCIALDTPPIMSPLAKLAMESKKPRISGDRRAAIPAASE